MPIAQTDQRLFKGTTAEILAFVPPAFTGWTYAESTTDNSAYRWNSTTSTWEPILAGSAAVSLSGTITNDVPSGVGDPIGTRPLASTLADGSTFVATDAIYGGTVYTHPTGGKLWYPQYQLQRFDNTATAGIATLISKLGMYDPVTKIFTRATVAGQFCNARSGAAQAVPGGVVAVTMSPGLLFATIAVGQIFTIGQLLMTDANGEWTAYVPGPGIIPLAWCPANTSAATGQQTMVAFDW
jgi:hypothetical protein